MSRGLVSDEVVRWARARYADYLAGNVSEDDMCAEMVTMNRGLTEAEMECAAVPFFEEEIAAGIFPDMKDLVLKLKDPGCEIWAVSSTSEWVIRAGMGHFGISPERRPGGSGRRREWQSYRPGYPGAERQRQAAGYP